MEDLIKRQDAIDAFDKQIWSAIDIPICKEIRTAVKKTIEQLPSAQPKRTEERTETHACDCISRQAAVDMFQNLAYDDWNQGAGTTWANAYSEAAEMVKNLPSAQPERRIGTPLLEKREWIKGYENRWYTKRFYCASCGTRLRTESWNEKRCFGRATILWGNDMPNYCPNCGAKAMEVEHE